MVKNKNNLIIYQSRSGAIEFRGDFERETIWATQGQIAGIFGVDRTVVVKHIGNIYRTNELARKATCAKIAQVAADGRMRMINLHNLDVILSVGYRVNSKKATSFRIWATKTLKDHLIKGYTVNRHRLNQATNQLKDLKETVSFLQRKSKHKLLQGQEKEILALLSDYSKTLLLLEKYDAGKIKKEKGTTGRYQLDYPSALNIIASIKKELYSRRQASALFGQEYRKDLQAILGNIYQSYAGKQLYPTLQEKAAHLMYFIIKDHPFVDGNKRIASFLFIYLLDRNGQLFKRTGERKINDNALVALALLVAVSQPKEKNRIIKIIVNLI